MDRAEGSGRLLHRWRRALAVLLMAGAVGAVASVPALGADEAYEPKVVGGSAVADGKYPFMASLQYDDPNRSPFEDHACGATLIDANHVLTAAHCVVPTGGNALPAGTLRIVVGTTVLSSSQGQARGVSSVSVHPRFNTRTFAYDAAVLRLDSPITGIAPIRLDAANSNAFETPGRLLRVAGWGTTRPQAPGSTGGSLSDRLREARPPVVSDSSARRVYGPRYSPTIMVAAGKKGVDTCQGDSGGPLFAPAGGAYRQVGITSIGAGCATARFPGVYTEISSPSVRNFILAAQSR